MKRSVTNVIRFVMDEMIPPLIRDSRVFMYPFFLIAYRGKDIKTAMNFKRLVHGFSEMEYAAFYDGLNTISRNRLSDLNTKTLNRLVSEIETNAKTLIDIGCGNGYLLQNIKEKHNHIRLTGFDVANKLVQKSDIHFVSGNIEKLPFADRSFDVVVCTHVLEHVLHPEKAVQELKRITNKQLIIVVPKQRYYYYTLDEHLQFFYHKESLTTLIDIDNHQCNNIQGDWYYTAKF